MHPASPPEPQWQRLDPRSIQLDRVVGWIVFGVLVGLYSGFVAVISLAIVLRDERGALWLPIALFALWPVIAGALAWVAHRLPELNYRYTSWRIDDVGLMIRTGVFWRTEISVARSRVQHIDVSQGPLERRFGLATLAVYTAGTEHSQVTLSGLAHPVALAARDALLPASDVDAV